MSLLPVMRTNQSSLQTQYKLILNHTVTYLMLMSFYPYRNRCNNCGCSRTDHKIAGAAKVDIPYLSHLNFGDVPMESSSPVLSQLEWYPPDLTDEQVP